MRPLVVAGSIVLDIVAQVERLPQPGETMGGATLARYPGGKGANQALAAHRLGAEVRLIARTGRDSFRDEALAILREEGIDLTGVTADGSAPTAAALISVAADGENQIVVASGANMTLRPEHLDLPAGAAVLCQLEVPIDTVAAAAQRADWFVLNTAPALDVPAEILAAADLLIANETEAAAYGEGLHRAKGLVAVTLGARGAILYRNGQQVARAAPPAVTVVDTVGAGDAFSAALAVALLEGRPPEKALDFACAAGALAVTRAGAQPSMPRRAEVEAILAR